MAHTVILDQLLALAEDGAELRADIYVPGDGGTSWPAVIIFTSSGFSEDKHSPSKRRWLEDSADNGWIAYSPRIRLDDPTHWIPGQTVNGIWPTQLNDCKRISLAVLADARCNGQYQVGGGSGGATHAAALCLDTNTQVTPVAWDTTKRPLGGVCLSPFCDFADRTPDDNLNYVISVANAYCNTTDLTQQRAKSPVALATITARPLFLVDGGDREHGDPGNDSMPFMQRILMGQALDAALVTNYTSIHLPTGGHAFSLYDPMQAQIHDFTEAIFAGGTPPPPPPDSAIPVGVAALITSGAPVPNTTINEESVDMISLRLEWATIQQSPILFDFSYFEDQISTVLASRPEMKFDLTIGTGEGSQYFGGTKPNWLFTLLATGSHVNSHGVCNNGSPLLTVGTATFVTPADVGKRISASKGTAGYFPAPAYIGVVNSNVSVEVSSSPSSNVPLNATANGTELTVETWPVGGISYDTHFIKPGVTYSFADGPTNTLTIPVFWDETLKARKRLLITMLGQWIAGLAPSMRSAIVGYRVAYANATSEDHNIPSSDTVKPGYVLSELDRWLLPIGGQTNPDTEGAGYTTQKMIDTIVTETPIDQTFTTGIISGSNLKCQAAGFSACDVGKVITGTGIGPGNQNTITAIGVTDSTSGATATMAANGTNGAVTFTIPLRQTGFMDVARAACPDQFTAMAIAQNGVLLDKPAADLAGDTDSKNYLARTVNNIIQPLYKPAFVTQINYMSAKITPAPPPAGSGLALYYEIALSGAPVASQALSKVFGDTTYRMNDGVPGDPDTILRTSGQRAAGYLNYFYEIYSADIGNLGAAVGFIHDLLLSIDHGGGPPPPPPPPPPTSLPPPVLSITGVNYRDDVQNQVADLLNVDLTNGLSPVRAKRWANGITRHVRYAWRVYRWPELLLTEERAFAPIWNATDTWATPERIYYLGQLQDDLTTILGKGYYDVVGSPPVGSGPLDDSSFFIAYTQTGRDYFIPLLQRCRRRIGDMISVFPSDPRLGSLNYSGSSLTWRLSNRGVEIQGTSSGQTVFIQYRVVPYKYSSDLWDTNVNYKADDLVLYTDGNVYRAIKTVSGIAPTSTGADAYWGFVPFPAYFAQYAAYMTAADDADDAANASQWRQLALQYLAHEIDVQYNQSPTPIYQMGRNQGNFRLPPGTSGFVWSVNAPFTNSTDPATNTISDICLSQWGDVTN